jgi:hypothetical protein
MNAEQTVALARSLLDATDSTFGNLNSIARKEVLAFAIFRHHLILPNFSIKAFH